MQEGDGCNLCRSPLSEIEAEVVCTRCGAVYDRTLDFEDTGKIEPEDLGPLSLGSFMGPMYVRLEEYPSFRRQQLPYIKVVSDQGLKTQGNFADYMVLSRIRRVCESLGLNQLVMAEAYRKARSILKRRSEMHIPLSAVTAYSIICALKTLGIKRVGVRDVIETIRAQGYVLKTSHIFKGYVFDGDANRPLHARDLFTPISERLLVQESLMNALLSRGLKPELYRRRLVECAIGILSLLPESYTVGRNPRAMAATILYAAEAKMASSEARKRFFTQRMVAQAAGVAEYTVREQFCEIVSPFLARLDHNEASHADQVLVQAIKDS
jgi:transcription initiation factor TFIIIB Brf1 subunit/transcription initiation factor TFIIB